MAMKGISQYMHTHARGDRRGSKAFKAKADSLPCGQIPELVMINCQFSTGVKVLPFTVIR